MIDIGGGDSRLVDHLLARRVTCVTVLDVSRSALDRARARLSPNDGVPGWIEADVTGDWHIEPVDIWHDRATFHFLTDGGDRVAYKKRVARTVKSGGHIIVATFAANGPERCSGLPVVRYSPEGLAHEFRQIATPIHTLAERHVTPAGGTQAFSYALLRVGSNPPPGRIESGG